MTQYQFLPYPEKKPTEDGIYMTKWKGVPAFTEKEWKNGQWETRFENTGLLIGFLAPVPVNPDDEKAAEAYGDGFYKVLPYDHYESDYDYRTQVAKNKQVQEHFLAGCTHKAQTMYTRKQMEECWKAAVGATLYPSHHPDRDTYINSLK